MSSTTLREPAAIGGLYLLHFDPKLCHAQHYLGFSDDVRRRVHEHVGGGSHSSPLVRAAIAAGSSVSLTRVWVGGDRTLERKLKNRHRLAPLCPVCRLAYRSSS